MLELSDIEAYSEKIAAVKAAHNKISTKESNRIAFERWKANSMEEHTDEFILKTLVNTPDDICVSIICRSRKLSPDMVEAIYYITCGLFDKYENLFSLDAMKTIIDIKWHYDSDKEAIEGIKKILKYKTTNTGELDDEEKLFSEFPYDILSRLERILHGDDSKERVDWKAVREVQNMPKVFSERYKHKYQNSFGKGDVNDNFIPTGKDTRTNTQYEAHERWVEKNVRGKRKKKGEG